MNLKLSKVFGYALLTEQRLICLTVTIPSRISGFKSAAVICRKRSAPAYMTHSTMFLSNLASIMVFENAEEIDRVHNSNDNKYQYKANINATISILKEKVILMLITDSPRKSKKLMKHIYSELAHAVVPIRDGRSYPRVKKHKSSKFHQNQKA